MSSIKSVLAAIDRAVVDQHHVTTHQHHGIKIAGWFRPAGYDRVERTDLVLDGRLGRIEATVVTTTVHVHSHDAEGSVVATAVAEPTWELQCSLPGLTVEDLRRTVSSLGCMILE